VDIESLLDQLKKLDYFKYVLEAELPTVLTKAQGELEKGLLSANFDVYSDRKILASRDWRMFGIDGESLAEGDILKLLEDLSYVLEREGVVITEKSQEIGTGNGYTVMVNGKAYKIYEEEDVSKDGMAWHKALIGLMQIVNDLLEQSGSSARVYATHGGNDGAIYILTPDQYNFMIQNNINTADYSVKPNDINEIIKSYPKTEASAS